MYKVPILFIIFRRKDVALKSFERIRKAQPQKLYLACDGARENIAGEDKLVEETRKAVLDAIDWNCDVHTLFQPKNLGCGPGVFTAISWLFENEDQGIILEDDCVADTTFFDFAAEMLMRYKDDERIGMIAGTNQVADSYSMSHSYCFSKYAACWGWATWRRAWKNMQIDLQFLDSNKVDVFKNRGYLGKECSRWQFQINEIKQGHVSAWDWQWYFSLAAQNQLCIFPKVNLISNIGNDTQATHTAHSTIFHESNSLEFPLVHPSYVMPDFGFDKLFLKADNSLKARISRMLPYNFKQIIKRHLTS